MKNQSGFTLIEVIVVSAILSVVIFTSLSLVSGISQQSDIIFQRQRLDQLVQEINAALSQKEVCTQNLRGVVLSTDPRNPNRINSLDQYDSSGTITQNIVRRGWRSGGLEISEIQLVSSATNDGMVIAEISLIPRFVSGLTEISMTPRKINRTVVLSNGAINECASINTESTAIGEAICTSQGLEYNATTDSCAESAPPDITWAYGDAYEARCPEGTQPNPLSGWPCGCEQPPNYSETLLVSRTYTNGSVIEGGPSPSRSDWSERRGSCRCTYATDVGNAQTGGWRSWIECMRRSHNN